MADIAKTTHKGLGLPEHFDPSMEQMKKNMEVIDDILQKAVPNDLTSITDANGESNANTLKETGNYFIKSNASNIPVSGYAGIISVFKMGTYILQEWRSINSASYTYRRYSTNTGSSWNSWSKDWNTNNDGSGSGLDADLLDGLHATSFFRVQSTISNFNSAISEGKWRITSGTNAPYTSCTDWICLVYHLGSTTNEFYQIAYEECNSVPTGISGGSTSSYSNMPLMFIRKRINSSTWSSWQVMWHSGIDGSGSGMDADKLDGKHSNELPYVPVTVSTYNTVNIDSYQTDGFFSLTEVTSATTLPTFSNSDYSGYGLLVKLSKGNSSFNCCHQLLFRDGSDEIYIRHYHNYTWSAWVQVGGTASDILTKLKTVDGTSSGLDSDLLDGLHASSFARTETSSFYTDFNTVPLIVGMYGLSGTASNAPTSLSTGTYSVIVTKTSNGYMMLAVNSVDGNIYRRHTTGVWSASTSWVSIGGTGLQQATATVVNSSGTADTTSYYLKIERADKSNTLKSGDVLSVSMANASTYTGSVCYVRYVDNTTAVSKYLYNANGSAQVPISQLPKYFLMRYDSSNFELLTPLNQTVTVTTSDPTETTTGKYGDIWYTY